MWNYTIIGNCFKTSSGGTPSKMHKEYYENGNIPWLRSGEVCCKNITKAESCITQSGLDNSSAKIFPTDTVLVAMYGATAGQVGILRFPATTNQAVCGILPNDSFIPEFIYYNFLFLKKQLISQAVGNAQPNISQEKIKNCSIPNLSLEEQRKIVEIIDKEFARIDALKANAEKSLKNVRDLFHSAMSQKLSFDNGWDVKSIKEIAKLKAGKFVSAKNIYKEKNGEMYPCYGGNGLRGFVEGYNQDGKYNLIGRQGALCGNINIAEGKFHATEHAVVVYPIIDIDFNFLNYSLINANLNQYATGAAQPGLSVENLNQQVFLSVPPMDEQIKISSVLKNLEDNLNELQDNYEKTIALCDDLKQSLLRKAFNGEL